MSFYKNEPADITVVLSVYNGGEYLKDSVASVLGQTHASFELLIMDDCSTDESWSWLQTIQDERVKSYRQVRNRGLFPCLNELIAKSKTGLIKLWSQDDIMNPDCLEETVNFHKRYPGIGFSYSDRETIDENGNILPSTYIDNTPELISSELHARIALYTGSIAGNIANVCINKAALEDVGLFHEEMKIAADFEMWARLAREHDTVFINKKLVRLREHAGQLSRRREYFIRVPNEDMEVFNYILGYSSEAVRQEGLQNLRKYKFVFYYTLMVKSFLNGRFYTSWLFYKNLRTFGHFYSLTKSFIKSKFSVPEKPEFIKTISRQV
jgi:glycosyltransferase involved in cell wall biosynthesis